MARAVESIDAAKRAMNFIMNVFGVIAFERFEGRTCT